MIFSTFIGSPSVKNCISFLAEPVLFCQFFRKREKPNAHPLYLRALKQTEPKTAPGKPPEVKTTDDLKKNFKARIYGSSRMCVFLSADRNFRQAQIKLALRHFATVIAKRRRRERQKSQYIPWCLMGEAPYEIALEMICAHLRNLRIDSLLSWMFRR